MSASFKAYAIDSRVDFGHAYDLRDLLAKRGLLTEVDDFATEALRLGETFGDEVSDDGAGSAEQMATTSGYASLPKIAGKIDLAARRIDGQLVDENKEARVIDLGEGGEPDEPGVRTVSR